jgi:CubicO group peptidase (beta-lactamase class C family)
MMRKIVRVLVIVFIVILIIAAAGYLWAYLSTGSSLTARGIMWGDAKADDWKRYPSRTIPAAESPVYFQRAETDIFDDFPIDERPLAQFLEATSTTAFIVLHDNELLYEGYFNDSSHEDLQPSLSAAKSFASTLVGIAIEEGFINNLDDPLTDYVPELLDRDPRFAAITIRNLLNMRSGLRFESDPSNPYSDDFITYASPDLRTAALQSEIVESPGERFHYNDYNPLLVGMILERATGMTIADYMATRLWGPMGAEADGSWDLDSEKSGFEKMSVGLNGRPIDMAKLGWIFLHGGKNGERQVVPATWVEETTRTDEGETLADHSSQNYRHYWWIDPETGGYNAEGNFCQFIYVYPPADLVLVRHGHACGGVYWTGLLGDIAREVESRLEH